MNQLGSSRLLSRSALRALLDHHSRPCLSLYFSATPGNDAGQLALNRSHAANLLAEAASELAARDVCCGEIDSLLQPLRRLLGEEEFWRRAGEGVSVFRSPELLGSYRLPLRFGSQLVVGERFHLKPLLPLLYSGGRCFVLALSQDSARLYESTREAIRELPLSPSPTSIASQATPADIDRHDSGELRTKRAALDYFTRVNTAVTAMLQGQEAPLVLACVGYLAPLYESTNTYARLIKAKVPGSPKMWTDQELGAQAWQLLESDVRRRERAVIDAAAQAASRGRLLTAGAAVVAAARQGEVSELLMRSAAPCDPESIEAAEQTLKSGGDVYVLERIPGAPARTVALSR